MTLKYQRDVFINEIYKAAIKNKNIFIISADFGAIALDQFREKLPKQFIHAGISEQHMINMSAGLALSGKKVYVYAMAPFITLRCLEQIKCSLAIMDLPVTILAAGVGLGYADAGPTHYTTEDIACLRSIANMQVYSASDEVTTTLLASLTLNHPKLRTIRLERNALPNIYLDSDDIKINQGYQKIKDGEKVCLLSYGHLLHRVIEVNQTLVNENINVGLYDVFCLKPISKKLILELEKYKYIISIEEQCLDGGFGSAILEVLCENNMSKKVKRLGLPERYFFENGGREYLLDTFGLSHKDIIKAVKTCYNNKF